MRKLIAVTVLIAGVIVAPAPAQAAPPEIEGYVWGHDPVNPNYFPATGYEYNSAGGPIQIIRIGVGDYHVRFHGMAGEGGVAHASAYGSNANVVCTVNAYGPREDDEVVLVRCFDTGGNPADARFVANVTNRKPAVGRLGYLWSHNPVPPIGGYVPSAQWSFDSTGQPIVVSRTGVGRYRVKLGTFANDSGGLWTSGYLRVTAHSPVARHCQILDPAFQADPSILEVRCYDMTGFGADSRFTLTYARGLSLLGGAVPRASATVDSGFAPVVTGWSNTAGGAPTVVEWGLGSYVVSFPKAGVPRGHAIASIMGTGPMFCNIAAWWQSGGQEHLWLRCWDGNVGVPTPAVLFNVAFQA